MSRTDFRDNLGVLRRVLQEPCDTALPTRLRDRPQHQSRIRSPSVPPQKRVNTHACSWKLIYVMLSFFCLFVTFRRSPKLLVVESICQRHPHTPFSLHASSVSCSPAPPVDECEPIPPASRCELCVPSFCLGSLCMMRDDPMTLAPGKGGSEAMDR